MSREKVYAEIKETLGQVPGFFEEMPDECIEGEWQLFKAFELEESSIPPKYRELIGVAIASAGHCWYCTNFHSALAHFHGASEREIKEAALLAKFGTGWSSYLNGINYDKEQFKRELVQVGEHLTARKK
jgi:AhpD family alkylhydroperoxidase